MRKGMSQVLALIVAASVLMMTALTVIFLTQGSLSGIGEQSTKNTCVSTAETQCQVKGKSAIIDTPSSCLVESGDGQKLIPAAQGWGSGGNNQLSCEAVLN